MPYLNSGYGLGSYRVPEPTINDGDRNPRSLRRSERDVVAVVRKCRSTEIRADLDYFVFTHDVRGDHIRPKTGGGHGICEHFSERETRFVLNTSLESRKIYNTVLIPSCIPPYIYIDTESKKKLVTLAKMPETNRTQIESCRPNPCSNGGTCVLRKATQTYYCKCHGNYTGNDNIIIVLHLEM